MNSPYILFKLWLLLTATLSFSATPPLKIFTDQKGREIRAALTKVEGTEVTLLREDGIEFTLKRSSFSVKDQDKFDLWLEEEKERLSHLPTFFGIPVSSGRVVFAIDLSASMGAFDDDEIADIKAGITPDFSDWRHRGSQRKHRILRGVLIETLTTLPHGTEYQILFFTGKVWAHDSVEVAWLSDTSMHEDHGKNWAEKLTDKQIASSGFRDKIQIPKFSYLQADTKTLSNSAIIVARTPTSLGTNWEHPLLGAFSLAPKPDTIFFLTDGAVTNTAAALAHIALKNQDKSTVVHSISLGSAEAMEGLKNLAKNNGGLLSEVKPGGDHTVTDPSK